MIGVTGNRTILKSAVKGALTTKLKSVREKSSLSRSRSTLQQASVVQVKQGGEYGDQWQ